MTKAPLHRLRQLPLAATVATAVLLAACGDVSPLSVERAPAPRAVTLADGDVDLGLCQNLKVEAGNELSFHAYATGVQIYRWSGSAWVFVEPSATLYTDAGGHGTVGTHYVGPTWESTSGSKVVGAVDDRCPADGSSIPWLRLRAVSSAGPGVFNGTTFILRLNTTGGKAPAYPGGAEGEIAEVPYTAEYYFYRAE
jgi:hypothetical protein